MIKDYSGNTRSIIYKTFAVLFGGSAIIGGLLGTTEILPKIFTITLGVLFFVFMFFIKRKVYIEDDKYLIMIDSSLFFFKKETKIKIKDISLIEKTIIGAGMSPHRSMGIGYVFWNKDKKELLKLFPDDIKNKKEFIKHIKSINPNVKVRE